MVENQRDTGGVWGEREASFGGGIALEGDAAEYNPERLLIGPNSTIYEEPPLFVCADASASQGLWKFISRAPAAGLSIHDGYINNLLDVHVGYPLTYGLTFGPPWR